MGIGFHPFIDDFVYSISLTVSLFTRSSVAIGMALHEFPDGIIDIFCQGGEGSSGKLAGGNR